MGWNRQAGVATPRPETRAAAAFQHTRFNRWCDQSAYQDTIEIDLAKPLKFWFLVYKTLKSRRKRQVRFSVLGLRPRRRNFIPYSGTAIILGSKTAEADEASIFSFG